MRKVKQGDIKKADDEIMNDKFAHVNEKTRNINLKKIFVKRYEKKKKCFHLIRLR